MACSPGLGSAGGGFRPVGDYCRGETVPTLADNQSVQVGGQCQGGREKEKSEPKSTVLAQWKAFRTKQDKLLLKNLKSVHPDGIWVSW